MFEKNTRYGLEISSRNSEVIHSGIYYPPEMLKSRLCTQGNHLLYSFCESNKIPHTRCGKLVIINDNSAGLENLYKRAKINNVSVEKLSNTQIKRIEPNIRAIAGLSIESTGTIDVHILMQALYYKGHQNGVNYLFNSDIMDINYIGDSYIIETSLEIVGAETVINCAGLGAEKIASLVGIATIDAGYQLHPCKGEYFKLKNKFKIQRLIYPLPGPNSLGIHLSRDSQGGLRLGPSAYYVTNIDYQVDENNRDLFYQAAKEYLPTLIPEDISPDFAGIRPKLQAPGEDMRDFIICNESNRGYPNFINLIGIESPGLTSCLAIAKYVKDLIQ